MELGSVEAVDHFFDLVEVGLVAILVGIDQDVVSISASEQISQRVELGIDEGLPPRWSNP